MGLGRLLNSYLLAPFDVRLVRRSHLATLHAALNEERAGEEKIRELTKRLRRREHKRLSGVDEEAFFALARHFSPRSVVGHRRIRVGRPHDGGYVMLDDFDGIGAAFSFGIGNDASWDVAIAQRGIPTYQFDHTIDASPSSHPQIHFFRHQIVGTPDEDGVTIGAVLARHGDDRDATSVLKMDIEGAEWPAFANAEPGKLRRFSQIVCEFHRFHRVGDAAWYGVAKRAMENLAADFEVIHVHANNASPFVLIGDVPFPQTLEATLANRARYQFIPCCDTFPTALDQANIPGTPDFYLGQFQF